MVQILSQFNDSLRLGDETVPAQDTVLGLDGSDTLVSDETVGGSLLSGNRDSDSLVSQVAGNVIYGGQENDRLLSLNSGGSLFFGDLGDDLFESFGGTGKDTVYGGTSDSDPSDGDDVFNFGNGLGGNLGFGNTGDDFLSGSGFGQDTIWGGKDDDTIQVVEVSGSGSGSGSTGFVPESIEGASFTVSAALNTTGGGGTSSDGVGVVETSSANSPLNPGKNYLSGDLGDDLVIGLGDRDSLFGGEGIDTLVMLGNISADGQAASNENTSLAGNAEDLNGVPQNASLVGGAGDDSVVAFGGTRGRNTLWGGEGNDTMRNFGDETYVNGEAGNDTIFQQGGFGESTLMGAAGDDSVDASAGGGTNLLWGGVGSDTLVGSNVATEAGQGDTLYGGDMANTDTSADSLTAGAFSVMFGNQGNDTLVAIGANASLYGGQDSDSLLLGDGTGTSYLSGDLGSDTLVTGANSNNTLLGGEGNDSLYGADGTVSSMVGGEGNDILVSGADGVGTDLNTLIGGAGDDFFVGSDVDDTFGGESDGGADTLYGGLGADSLIGTSGEFDGFYYVNNDEITADSLTADTITAFESDTDKIYLRSEGFGNTTLQGSTTGPLGGGAGNALRDGLDFKVVTYDYLASGTFSGDGTTQPAIVFQDTGSGGILYSDYDGATGTDLSAVSVIAVINTGRVQADNIMTF
jgi:Ca2+-binding RTX toxin-like protein